jgi:hypothetical protein
MTTKGEHEMSTFTLDVYWAQGKPRDPAVEVHVSACARCRAYLATLDGALADGALEARGPAPVVVPLRRRARWVWLAAAMFVLPAGVLLLAHTRSAATAEYVGMKGTPAVQVLLHRGADTRIWDGQSPVRPGDALALRVACEGLEYVAVAAPGAGAWARLSDSACPAAGDALPFTLVVDGEPGDEKLAVVLSQSPLDDGVLRDAISRSERTKDVWVVDFVLPKETGTDR